jgi:hypothetical protein
MNERDLPPSVTSGPALLRQETTSGGAKFQTMTRRSTRVRARIPILITSLDPTTPFSLPCETMLVNVHGCAARITQPLEIGMPVRLRVRDSREITARVVICQPVQGDQPCWVAGIELDKPGNIWGLTRFPEDWARFDQETEQSKPGEPAAGRSAIALKMPVWPLASPSAKAGFPAQAHEELKTQLAAHQQTITGLEDRLAKSMAALPGIIQRQLADAQRETLAQALQQFDARLAESLPQQSPVETEAIAQMQERLAAAESLLGRTRQQLADAHEQTQEQVRKQLGATLAESLKPLQEELAASRKKAEEAQQVGAAVAEQRNARDQQATARWQALETSAQTVQKELARAHEELKTRLAAHQQTIAGLEDRLAKSMAALPDVIQRHLADAQQETLAQALQQFDARLAGSLPQQSPKQTEAIVQMQERLAAAESLLSRTRQQLADAHAQTQEQVRKQLGATLTESLKPLQEELAACQKKAEEARQIGAGVAAQRNAQDQQTTARWQALEASAQAVQKELAQARGLLESSTQGLTQRIQEPITAAVQEALAEARARISAELARESESLQEGGRSAAEELRGAADSLRSEREATMAQLAALDSKRAELQLWLTEQQAAYTRHVNLQLEQFTEQQSVYANGFREKLEQLAGELAARSLRMLEEKVRSDVEKQAERTGAEVRQHLDAMLERTSGLRQDALSLLDALQRENERCQTQMQALLNEKDTVDDWMRERAAEFRKTFHDALVETTGQIRGRLQMATEMMEQPLEKLRQQAAEQLQEQAGRQARHLREHADEVTERLRGLQRDIETAVRESLRAQAAETVATCGREIAEVAQRTVEEWRATLASNLESLTRLLGQPIPRDRQ